jgi:hypothetical protein
MLPVGTTIANPITGIEVTLVEVEPSGLGFTIDYLIQPHVGRDAVAHMHIEWTEEFAILEGAARYVLDGQEQTAEAGANLIFRAGVLHLHPWNGGPDVLRVRQKTRFVAPNHQAIIDTLEVYTTLYGLARDGKANRRGLPNPLQLALMLRKLQAHGGYIGGLPHLVQRLVFGSLAALGRLCGFQATYDRYTKAPGSV